MLPVELSRLVAQNLQMLGILPRDSGDVRDPLPDGLHEGIGQAVLHVAPACRRSPNRRHAIAGERAVEFVARRFQQVVRLKGREEVAEFDDPRVTVEHARAILRVTVERSPERLVNRAAHRRRSLRWVALACRFEADIAHAARKRARREHEVAVAAALAAVRPSLAVGILVVAILGLALQARRPAALQHKRGILQSTNEKKNS